MNNSTAKVTASLYSIFIGDALSMPVHWFYRVSDIIREFPPYGVTKMEAAPPEHPSSIMSLHSTKAGGRRHSASDVVASPGAIAVAGDLSSSGKYHLDGEIIGDVILKGKRELWGGSRNHYHHGMQAGDNTLNACCARLMVRHLVENNGYNESQWLDDYINFMTSEPAAHPDTYAESYHRGFFANLQNGKALNQCGAITHDTPSMGALVTVAPIVFALQNKHTLEDIQQTCREHVQLTHPDSQLLKVVSEYVAVLHQFVFQEEGTSLGSNSDKEVVVDTFVKAASVIPGAKVKKYLDKPTSDGAVVGGQYSTACYITDSWPSVCYLAAKYHDTPSKALLTNTNLGGENAHRGAVLGSLIGAVDGEYDEALFQQLLHGESITEEVKLFTNCFS